MSLICHYMPVSASNTLKQNIFNYNYTCFLVKLLFINVNILHKLSYHSIYKKIKNNFFYVKSIYNLLNFCYR